MSILLKGNKNTLMDGRVMETVMSGLSVKYSRLGVCRLVALKGMTQVVLVVHVTLCAQVIVEAHLTLPSHSHDAVLLTAVADDVGVTDS